MMKSLRIIILMMSIALVGAATDLLAELDKTYNTGNFDENNILLPTQINHSVKYASPEIMPNAKDWEAFSKENGDWNILIDPNTKTPHRAFGESFKISGYSEINSSNIDDAALAFLSENEELFNIDLSQIQMTRAEFVNNRWYVSFKQFYQGVEVLLSEIELRIFKNGNVMAFGIDFYNDINCELTPELTTSDAASYATYGIEDNAKADKALSSSELYILPVKTSNGIEYNLVYSVMVNDFDNLGRYKTFVNAHNGNVVWRQNMIHKADITFSAKGGIRHSGYKDEEVQVNFPHQYVLIDGTRYETDDNGNFTADVSTGTIKATLEGPWCSVSTDKSSDASFSGTASGDEFELVWDDDNSHFFERNMFFHTNYAHDFFKEIDPNLTEIDEQFNVELQFTQSQMGVNAYSDGTTITFLSLSDNSMYMAKGPSVLFHEYGHGITTLFYTNRTGSDMNNMTCHEAMADFTSIMIMDMPYIGKGVFADDEEEYIRNCKNKYVFPDDIEGESHHDSQILSGAFWDFRELTTVETALKTIHFARYGLPDDPSNAVAFTEWFIEVLVSDDDDGDLSNGTPHLNEIVTAFNNHQIGTNLLLTAQMIHDPLDDTENMTTPYPVVCKWPDGAAELFKPESLKLYYKTTGASWEFIEMAYDDAQKEYSAYIPALEDGGMVSYYFVAKDPVTSEEYRIDMDIESDVDYTFLVGYKTAFFDNLEENDFWIERDNSDNATVGMWELAVPELVALSGTQLRPNSDYSDEGGKCYMTGAATPPSDINNLNQLLQYMPNGKATLTTESFDLTKLEKPVIKFYYYFSNVVFLSGLASQDNTTYLKVQISNDGGSSWKEAFMTQKHSDDWSKAYIDFSDYLTPSANCKVRFVHNVLKMYNMPVKLSFALVDDFEILTANEQTINSVEELNLDQTAGSAYPNPFSSSVTISFTVDTPGDAAMKIFNSMGEEVSSENLPNSSAGTNSVSWDGTDNLGNKLNSGVYYYRIISNEKIINGALVKY